MDKIDIFNICNNVSKIILYSNKFVTKFVLSKSNNMQHFAIIFLAVETSGCGNIPSIYYWNGYIWQANKPFQFLYVDVVKEKAKAEKALEGNVKANPKAFGFQIVAI